MPLDPPADVQLRPPRAGGQVINGCGGGQTVHQEAAADSVQENQEGGGDGGGENV